MAIASANDLRSWWKVVRLPRHDDAVVDPFRGARGAALSASWASGALDPADGATGGGAAGPDVLEHRRLAWLWRRVAAAQPVELWTADARLAPPGSGLVPVAGEVVAAGWTGWSWRQLGVSFDPPTGRGGNHGHGDKRQASDRGDAAGSRGLPSDVAVETGLLAVWDGPFALLTTADPAVPAQLEDYLFDLATEVKTHYSRRDVPERMIQYERTDAWHRELHGGLAGTGVWLVRLWVGVPEHPGHATEVALTELAGLAAASLDTEPAGYRVTATRTAGMNDAYSALAASDKASGAASDTAQDPGDLAGRGFLEVVTRPPRVEVPGIQLVRPSEFDTTPETPTRAEGYLAGEPSASHDENCADGRGEAVGVMVGEVLDRQLRPAGGLTIGLDSLNRHMFVAGATGSGKSTTVRRVLVELTRLGVPWLVVEPSKAEYHTLINELTTALGDDLPQWASPVVIRPGDPDAVPVGLDPLRPVPGFALATHLEMVKALFLAAFQGDEPFPQVLSAALSRAYEQQGWNTMLDRPRHPDHTPRYPTLTDLIASAEQVVDSIGYGREVADNIRGFVGVRLESLRHGTTGRFLEGGYQLDLARVLSRNVVLQIEDVGDHRDKALLMGTVLLALTEHHRVQARERSGKAAGLRHVTVFEEAHRLLRRPADTGAAGPAAQAVEAFADLLAEVRAYGEGLVVAEQIPSKIITDVIKNSAVKITHRLPAADDRQAVGATMNLTDAQSDFLVTLPPGHAAAHTDGMDHAILTRIPAPLHHPAGATTGSTTASGDGPQVLCEPTYGRCNAAYPHPPASLDQIGTAAGLLESHPGLVVWIELTTLAHLCGWPPPLPSERLHAELINAHDPATLALMTVTAVDDAVATRSPALVDRMPPAAFAAHLAKQAVATLTIGVPGCSHPDHDDTTWIAAPFQHAAEEIALRRDPTMSADPARQARLADIERDRYQHIRSGRFATILFGTGTRSPLERLADCDRTDPDWPTVLGDLTHDYTGLAWARGLLTIPTSVSATNNHQGPARPDAHLETGPSA